MSFSILSQGVKRSKKEQTVQEKKEINVFTDVSSIVEDLRQIQNKIRKVEKADLPAKEKEGRIVKLLNLKESKEAELKSSLNIQDSSSKLEAIPSFREIIKRVGLDDEVVSLITDKLKFKVPSPVQACCILPIIEVFS